MSKELKAFENIMRIYGETNSLEGTYNDFLTIKKALQRLDQIENAKPSEALKCLEYIGELCYVEAGDAEEDCVLYAKNYIGFDTIKNYILKAQEQKKVLEIINNKQVDVNLFITIIPFNKSIEELTRAYNQCFIERCRLTTEETNSIKRWIDNELSNDES